MKKVAFISSKGGTGKSMLVVTAAVAATLAYPQVRVGLIDADPQGTSATWWSKRGPSRIELFSARGHMLVADVEAIQRRVGPGLLFIDTPSGSSSAQEQAAMVADAVVIPVGATGVDIDAVARAETLCRAVGHVPYFVLNRDGPRTRIAGGAVARLRATGRSPIAVIHQRVAISQAMEAGLTAMETDPGGVAAHELQHYWARMVWLLALNLPRIPYATHPGEEAA
jgi:chromosome partitioning protein